MVLAAGGSLRSIPSSRCKRYRQAAFAAGEISALGKSIALSACLCVLNQREARVHKIGGGARRDRTDDLLLAKQALSQLSYGPVGRVGRSARGKPEVTNRRLTSDFWLLISGF